MLHVNNKNYELLFKSTKKTLIKQNCAIINERFQFQ